MFEKIKEISGGERERIKTYVNLYLEMIPSGCQTIEDALESGQLNKVAEVLHDCKVLFSTFGFDNLYKKASEIEHTIKANELPNPDTEEIQALTADLKRSAKEMEVLQSSIDTI